MTPIDEIINISHSQNYGFSNMESHNEDEDNRMVISKKKRALLKKATPYKE
jgi:hypothetical protein